MKPIGKKIHILWSTVSAFLFLGIGSCSPLLSQNAIEQKIRATNENNADCPLRFPHSGYCAKLVALDAPFVVGRSHSFRLFFWQAGQVGSAGVSYSDPPGTMEVWLWMEMTVESHGSLDVVVRQALDESRQPIVGVYDLTRVIFTMSSRSSQEWWEMHIRLRDETGLEMDEAIEHVGP